MRELKEKQFTIPSEVTDSDRDRQGVLTPGSA